ncbi:MAG: ornithine cyclodeaminase family protein [Ardenticatenaceae bacterium]|nr:ornithine cyclodeaminase family protein [Ardenticatenaceae bacterium]
MRSVNFLFLSQEDVIASGGLDMAAYIQCVEQSFSLHDKDEAMEPDPPMLMFGGQAGRRVTMHPAYVGGDVNTVGLKWTPANPDNPRTINMPRATAIDIINDPITGHPLAIMDGTIISAMRTGGVTAVGFKYLGRQDASVVGLLGAGVLARTQLMGLKEVMPNLKDVKVFDLLQDKARAWADEMCTRLNVPVRAVGSAQECVEDSDAVVGCTTVSANKRYVKAEWFKEGIFYSNISDNDATFEAILSCDKVVVDGPRQFTIPVVMGLMAKEGLIGMDRIHGTIGEIINGKKPGRENDREKIFYSCLGLGVHDIINARRIYEEARRQGRGVPLQLWQEPYWA